MNADDVPKISAVLNPLMVKHKMKAEFPMPVWDDTGTLIGVKIYKEKQMGHMKTLAEASFVLAPADVLSAERMTRKAMIAIDAITYEVRMGFRTLKPKQPKSQGVNLAKA